MNLRASSDEYATLDQNDTWMDVFFLRTFRPHFTLAVVSATKCRIILVCNCWCCCRCRCCCRWTHKLLTMAICGGHYKNIRVRIQLLCNNQRNKKWSESEGREVDRPAEWGQQMLVAECKTTLSTSHTPTGFVAATITKCKTNRETVWKLDRRFAIKQSRYGTVTK